MVTFFKKLFNIEKQKTWNTVYNNMPKEKHIVFIKNTTAQYMFEGYMIYTNGIYKWVGTCGVYKDKTFYVNTHDEWREI